MNQFSVSLYNSSVRAKFESGEENTSPLCGDWADIRCVKYLAASAEEARRFAERDYPEHLGFKIVDVIQLAVG